MLVARPSYSVVNVCVTNTHEITFVSTKKKQKKVVVLGEKRKRSLLRVDGLALFCPPTEMIVIVMAHVTVDSF